MANQAPFGDAGKRALPLRIVQRPTGVSPRSATALSRGLGAPARHQDPAPATGPAGDLQRLHRRIGNRSIAALLQPKLRLGAPNDRYEQEADRVADQVMNFPATGVTAAAPGGGLVQRCGCHGSCATCSAREEEDPALVVQRWAISAIPEGGIQRDATETCAVSDEPKEEGEEDVAEEEEEAEEGGPGPAATTISPKRHAGGPAPPDDLETRLEATRGRGAPLPSGARAFMESRFGYDFSGVRVHTGARSEGLNRDVNSLAFTTGTDIYFAAGEFRPDSDAGRRLLAHELTHVVQQAGGADAGGPVREKAVSGTLARKTDWERKAYYGHRVSGTTVHHVLERILREADEGKDLVTEAAIPGADRFSPELNKIGVADLYKSKPPKTVSGVKGFNPVASPRDIVGMNNPGSVGTRPAVTSSPKVTGKRDAPVRGWEGDFPSEIRLGEIKPASTTKAGAGIAQLDSYERGYQAFVGRLHTISGGKTRASLKFSRLKVTLPDRLNFDKWSSQHSTPSKDTTFGGRRLWVADLGGGLYLYTDFASGLEGAPPEWFSVHITKMRKSKDELTPSHPRTPPMVSGKFLPGGPRIPVAAAPRTGSARHVQRHTKDRPANYWPDRGRAWETARGEWARPFRTALKTTFKNYRDKVRFEKQLGKAGRSAPAAEKKAVRDYNQLMFWSGRAGKFLGKVRFLLGGAWDKVLGVFERMKEKMAGVRARVKGVSEGGIVKFGWARRLVQVVVAASKVAVGQFITESFNFFAACFHAAMDKVVEKVQGEVNERLGEELCRARKLFEDSKARLEAEWGEGIKRLEELFAAIQDAKRWLDIATSLITLIRVGVQVVSCLTPPALGCLWGLVAQIGIGAAVDLLIGTRWFNDNIVTPTVRDLVRKYGTPHYQGLINRALGDDLKEYHCHLADSALPSLDFKAEGGLEGAALRSHRDAWEGEYESEILKGLQTVFGTGKGKKPTKEQLQQLVKLLQESKRTPEELKAMLEAARTPLTGKLDVEKAKANVGRDEVKAAEPKVREIDYPHATRQNAIYQKTLGWDPFTFYRKPGIKADSEEFADAVYDLQEALRLKKRDGILGEETLIAFYERNKVKKDIPYRDAVKMRDEKKAAREKAAAEKAEKARAAAEKTAGEAGAGGAGTVAKPPAPTYTLLNGPEHVIRDEALFSHVPVGVRVFLHAPAYRTLVTTSEAGERVMTSEPQFVTLDISVDGKHAYRVQNVAVKRMYVSRIYASMGGFAGEWLLTLILLDGIQLTIKGEEFVLREKVWGADR